MPSILLKKVPKDIYNFIIDVQGEMKKNRQITQFSLESAIYKIINDSRKCVEEIIEREKETQK